MTPAKRVNIVILSVFGDESADETKDRAFAVGGVIGSEELWQPLEEAWVKRCNGIPFHANDCDSDKGDFKQFHHKQNKELYKDLVQLFANSGLGGYGIVLNLIARKAVFPEAMSGLDYYKGFLEVIDRMRNSAAYNHCTVRFTFDKRRESEHNSSELYAMVSAGEHYAPFLDSEISFACSKRNPRIQVADLFTREVMKCLDNDLVGRRQRKSWLCLRETQRFHCDEYGQQWFEGLRDDLSELEVKTGMSMKDYEWVADRN